MNADGNTPTDAPGDTKSQDVGPLSEVPDVPVSQKRKCSHISGTGAACGAFAVKNSPFCFYHDPSPEAIAKRERGLRDKNKRSNAKDGLPDWESRPLDTLEAVRDALSELFNSGARGDVSAARLSALSAISNSISKAIEGSDLEERIAALEEKLKLTEAKK